MLTPFLQWFPQVACSDRPSWRRCHAKLVNSETTEGMWSNWLVLSPVAGPVIVSLIPRPPVTQAGSGSLGCIQPCCKYSTRLVEHLNYKQLLCYIVVLRNNQNLPHKCKINRTYYFFYIYKSYVHACTQL